MPLEIQKATTVSFRIPDTQQVNHAQGDILVQHPSTAYNSRGIIDPRDRINRGHIVCLPLFGIRRVSPFFHIPCELSVMYIDDSMQLGSS